MRWAVLVTAVGSGGGQETFVVDADSWQKALQNARTARGDSGPMSGFSIELLDDGCRAIDPMARLRFEVQRTTDDTPLTTGRSKPLSVPPPRPSGAPQGGVAAQAATNDAQKKSLAKTAFMGSGAAVASPSIEPPRQGGGPRDSATTLVTQPTPSVQILSKREQDASDALPITYREYAFAVAAGTDESTAERVLLTQLEEIRAALSGAPLGKLVSLAVFDATFSGKPTVPPLAVLQWKDWRVAPVVAFPRRAGYVSPFARLATAPPPPVAAARPQPVAPPPPPPVTVLPAPQVISAPPPPPPPVAVQSAPPPPVAAPSAPPPPVIVAAPPPPPVVAAVPVSAPPPPKFPAPALLQTLPSAPPVAHAPASRRVRGDELVADLFDAMGDLHFAHDSIEGADFCLQLAMEKLGATEGLIHLYDIDRREFVVTATRGAAAMSLLLSRSAESDPLLGGAMRKRRAMVVGAAFGVDPNDLPRYATLGGVKSGLVAPVMQSGRFLGAIELLNPADDSPFVETDGEALDYIAQQLAEFVATIGVVTDADRVSTVATSRRPPAL